MQTDMLIGGEPVAGEAFESLSRTAPAKRLDLVLDAYTSVRHAMVAL